MNHNRLDWQILGFVAVATVLFAHSGSLQICAQELNQEVDDGSPGAANNEQVHVVETGLIAQQVVADANGCFACVFGQLAPLPSADGRPTRFDRHPIYGGPTHVVSVDLKTRKVLARHAIDGEVQQALVDDRYLYWKSKSVNVINRLAMTATPTLEQLPLRSAVKGMFFVADDRLALVIGEGHMARLQIYDRKSLTRLPEDPLGQVEFQDTRGPYGSLVRQRGDAELHISPRIIDQSTGKTKCLVDRLFGVPSLAPEASPTSTLINGPYGNSIWRRQFKRQQVELLSGGPLFHIPSRHWSVSSSFPLCASVGVDRSGRNRTYLLDIREVVYGRKIEGIALTGVGVGGIPNNGVQFSGTIVVVAVFNKLVVVDIDQRVTTNAAEPFRLLHPTLTVGSSDSPATFHLEARGGKSPYVFSLEKAVDGVAVDKVSGKIRLDLPSIWKSRIAGAINGTQPPLQITDLATARARQSDLTFAEQFEKHTGVAIPTDMLPTIVPLSISAADSSGQQDQVFAQALVMVPKQELEAANAAAAKLRSAQQARAMAERRTKQQGGVAAARLDDLERRLRRIESQLDAILSELDETDTAAGREE